MSLLKQPEATLPTHAYHDPDWYTQEIEAIWMREWFCIGRESDWAESGDYRVIELDRQQVVVLRDKSGRLNAFHNTCRHRGSQLCQENSGRLRGRIICPYHGWAYDLQGNLASLPKGNRYETFDKGDWSLYPVHLDTWQGFVFLNLSKNPVQSLADFVHEEAEELAAWPLQSLSLVHRESHELACNWKVFWENFMECYHCPTVHPDLCKLAPLYGQGVFSRKDLPEGHTLKEQPRLADGVDTWTPDGKTALPWFPELPESAQKAGMTFSTFVPTLFVVGHVDYVRSVRVLPQAPERTRLTIDWYLSPEVAESGNYDIEHLTAAGRQVVLEDGAICEINQKGLRSRAHDQGVLMPAEYSILWLRDWILERMPDPAKEPP